MSDLTLHFYGGVGSVTGANFVLEKRDGERVFRLMIDCGLIQGSGKKEAENYRPFPYKPQDINALIVTHAHMDHIGRIPKLVRDGFRGKIYSTKATMDIARPMFEDELKIMTQDGDNSGENPLFGSHDADFALALWEGVEYYEEFKVGDFLITLKDAGHILGSAIIEVSSGTERIVFTGDLGNSPAPFLRDTDKIEGATYMVTESVYGDRKHADIKNRTELLKLVIKDSIERGGTLIIPAFSLERTQILLYEINNFVENGEIPLIPVFLDSPLAIKITDIYRRYTSEFKDNIQKNIYGGDDIFDFPKLKLSKSSEDSGVIASVRGPKIIIAGSGMSYGGRILTHEREYLGDSRNTILFVGYQPVGSLGRQIQEGKKEVLVDDKKLAVNARVESIMSYSSHRDSDGLLEFVESSEDTLKEVFVAMGEPKASMFLAQRIRDYLGVSATVPGKDDKFKLI